ncbi:MAG: hypothetical protein JWR16_2868 [Nevskia sp.]|nr:hypothetical protein [Nevskia sp.]
MDSAVDPALFVNYIPLNALQPESQRNLARKSSMRLIEAGSYLFKIGDSAETVIFLVSGEIQLEDASGAQLAIVRAGAANSFHRIAHHLPRRVTAYCPQPTCVIAVDAKLLDVMLTWDQSGRFEVHELTGGRPAPDGDWMTKLLQMRIFQMVPPSNLQAMFLRMEEVQAEPGQFILRQGEPGDYFYVIKEGRCMVTREAPGQKPVRLAELESGSCFGEEALISESQRNASVIMLTRGRLMRLAQRDFHTLLNAPIGRQLSLPEAERQIAAGHASWLDVRLPSEFQRFHLPGSINLPLYMLRLKLATLDQSKTYIAVCDTGRRSSVAMFVLCQKGYDVYLLQNGLPQQAAS